jgi:30S ribosomal protein 3
MQNLKLQVLWLEDSLGLAINQKRGKEIFPITSYYFWPISKAWEQIRIELESKPWIPEEERLKLLNLVGDMMNKWQQSRPLVNENQDNPGRKVDAVNVTVTGIP